MKIINIFLKYNKSSIEDNNKDIESLLSSLNILFNLTETKNKDNNKNVLEQLKKHIEEIIKQEKKLFSFEKKSNKINGKNYPYFATKYLNLSKLVDNKEDSQEYIIKVYFIPKHFDMEEQILIEDKNNAICQQCLLLTYQQKFQTFYERCEELYSKQSYINQSLDTKKENFEYFELEKELIILKNIIKQLSHLKHIKEKQNIYSDMIIGEINYDLEQFNNNKEVIAQTIYVTNDKLFRIINSFIKAKFTHSFLNLLNENKYHQNGIFKEILKSYEIIKNKTYFYKEKSFIPKSRLQGYLKESYNKELYKKNQKLIQFLNELLLNNITYDSKYNYKRQTIPLDKVWEEYCQLFLEDFHKQTLNNSKLDKDMIQKSKEFLNIEIDSLKNKNDNEDLKITKISNPDFIVDDIVYDAKYKLLKNINNDKDNKDINKLCRDMLVHKKEKGVLIFVKEGSFEKKHTNDTLIYNNHYINIIEINKNECILNYDGIKNIKLEASNFKYTIYKNKKDIDIDIIELEFN